MKRAFVLFVLLGCARGERAITVEPVALPPATLPPASLPSTPQATCTKRIRLITVQPETPTCQVYGLAPGAEGTIQYPCTGSGIAQAHLAPPNGDEDETFDFSGSSTSGSMHLSNDHSEDIGDRCKWKFFQEIDGTIERLHFRYHEQIESGSGCYRPCGAVGDFEIVH